MDYKSKSLEYTCIFGGGAIRGVSYVGAVRAMEELGLKIDAFAGSSVGAIFAGLVAVGYTADELKDIFMQVNYELFRDIHFGFGPNFALSKGGIFLDWLKELIETKFYGERYVKGENPPVTFTDIDKNLVIITTDLTNFKYKEFSKFETPDFEIAYAIRISSSMPGLMKPVEINGAMLVDGDLQKSWPLWRLSNNLCLDEGRVLEFRLEGDFEGKGQNAVDFMNTVYSCVTSLATDFIVDTYGHRDKFDYIIINTGSIVVVDFMLSSEKRQELMDIGYLQTKDYFESPLIDKKQKIVKYYKNTLKSISAIKKSLYANNIHKTKEMLGELYLDFCGARRYIDLKYYEMVDDFKTAFLADVKLASIFGFYLLKKPEPLKKQIAMIELAYEEKILEIESYIFKI